MHNIKKNLTPDFGSIYSLKTKLAPIWTGLH